jgi:SAM-dependent methyltransferase
MITAQTKQEEKTHIADFTSARRILNGYQHILRDSDFAFASRVYSQDPAKYRMRLKAIGFDGLEHVLDAGCGFGQWTSLLAEGNAQVSACDISAERLLIAAEIIRHAGVHTCTFNNGAFPYLPYDDQIFDGLFCYGVIHATPWWESLRECHRVLLPGGKLYLTANSLGWYLHCWKNEPFREGDFDPRLAAAQSFVSTVQYERTGRFDAVGLGLIIDQNEMVEYVRQMGFEIIGQGAEGTINVAGNEGAEPFFKGEYEGQAGVFEILAVKR